jgi:hypothetical protein
MTVVLTIIISEDHPTVFERGLSETMLQKGRVRDSSKEVS